MTKPCFSIIGSKSGMSKFIIDRMPQHTTYVDVFGGSASVLLAKPPTVSEVYNDKNELLTNLFEVLRNDTNNFIDQYDYLTYNELLNKRWRKEPWPADPLEKAIRFWYCIVTSFNGEPDTGWCYNGPGEKKQVQSFKNKRSTLLAVANRFKNVYIMNRDFAKVIDMYDSPDTLFFLDPPYYNKEDYYNYSGNLFTVKDHKRLKDKLVNIKGKAMVTYYGGEQVEKLYKGWNIDKWHTTKSSVKADKRTVGNFKAIEHLYSNFEAKEKQLDLI